MKIASLHRYPVKSLSGESMDSVVLVPGRGIPGDRRFALAREANGPRVPWAKKSTFRTLVRDPKLAALSSTYAETGDLEIVHRGDVVASGNLTTAEGRAHIEDFFADFLGERPHLVEGEDCGLFDTRDAVVSMLNLASVQELERVIGATIEPARFRANIVLNGKKAWCERDWIGRRVHIGQVVLEVTEHTGRCAATHLDPKTAESDLNILKALQDNFGHTDMGVFARVIKGGSITKTPAS